MPRITESKRDALDSLFGILAEMPKKTDVATVKRYIAVIDDIHGVEKLHPAFRMSFLTSLAYVAKRCENDSLSASCVRAVAAHSSGSEGKRKVFSDDNDYRAKDAYKSTINTFVAMAKTPVGAHTRKALIDSLTTLGNVWDSVAVVPGLVSLAQRYPAHRDTIVKKLIILGTGTHRFGDFYKDLREESKNAGLGHGFSKKVEAGMKEVFWPAENRRAQALVLKLGK